MARLIGFRGLLCAAIAVVCALSGRASPTEPLQIITNTYPGPFRDDDKAPGPDIEILRKVFADMGQSVSFESFPPHRDWRLIERGERDGMAGVVRTSERERICLFPDEPLHGERSVLFVRTADAGKLKFSSFDDLGGHDVAVLEPMPGSSEHTLISPELWKFLGEHHNAVETSGIIEMLRMLAAGRVDYAVASLNLGERLIATAGLSGKIVPLLSRDVKKEGIYVCFARARVSPSLVEAFSRALRQFKQTDAYQAIIRKYSP